MTRGVRAAIPLMFLFVVCFVSTSSADPVTLTFHGTEVSVAGEFTNGVPVPIAEQEFARLFAGSRSISATVNYDTNQLDVDPDPNTGTYLVGRLSVSIPEIGLTAIRASIAMQISAFNDVFNSNDQFFAGVNGVDTFVNNVGLPVPIPDTSFTLFAFGTTSMLADDRLPTQGLAWTFGNVSFNFLASNGTQRQVLLTFVPAITQTPEQRLEALLSSIGDLIANGSLGAQQANGLLRPLRNVLRSLGTGHLPPACSQLRDFEVEVTRKILDGVLTAQQGVALIGEAESIRAILGC